MVTYYEIGANKRLNEVVIAGTHDAGIDRGGSGVQTQSLDIAGQAKAGVRFFDIRIAAAVTSETHSSGRPVAELRAFHADDKVVLHLDRKNVMLKGVQNPVKIEQSKLGGGAFGMGLGSILQQARNFVLSREGKNEFLILKFDKCSNWQHIANACQSVLSGVIFQARGNLNIRTLKELAGHVVVLFSSKGLGEIPANSPGIFGFKNLSGDKATYVDDFNGLQYYGKGGTSPFNPFNKQKQNITKQTKLMQGAAGMDNPDIIGMMYWTTTGLLESIEKRDAKMWEPPNVAKMKTLWRQGLEDFVTARISLPSTNPLAEAQQRRSFFPNIVMIDFADDPKCEMIRGLNDLTASHITSL